MQKVIVQIDWYTKIVLTLIAALLAGLLAKPYIAPKPVGAYDESYITGDVTVNNSSQYPIPVKVTNPETYVYGGEVRVNNQVGDSIPVEVTRAVEVEGSVEVEGPVKIKTGHLGTVDANISSVSPFGCVFKVRPAGVFTVVDWKKLENYVEYRKQQIEKRKKESDK